MERLRLAALAAAILVMLIVPSHAHAAKGMEVAVQDDSTLVWRAYYNREKALDHAERLQVTWIRANLLWSSVVGRQARKKKAPKRVTYDWRLYDDLVNSAAARGIHVQLAITGPAPRYATGDRHVGVKNVNSKRYAQFAQATAQHFKGRVTRYSIWNEPNHKGWLQPVRRAATLYRSMYKRGYRAIKAVDPGAQVLFGETAPYSRKRSQATSPLLFLRQVTCVNRRYKPTRNCRLLADGFAHHPYEYLHPPDHKFPGRDNVTMSGLPKLVRALNKLGDRKVLRTPQGKRLDIYLTEFGYFGRGKYRISETKRAKYLVRGFEMAQRNPRVRQMLQYLLIQPAHAHSFFDTSIVSRKGKLSRAFRKLASWASKAAKKGKIAIRQEPPPPPPPPEPEPEPEPSPVPTPVPPPPPPPPPPCDPLVDPLCVVPTL
jgi:hypothetical protein